MLELSTCGLSRPQQFSNEWAWQSVIQTEDVNSALDLGYSVVHIAIETFVPHKMPTRHVKNNHGPPHFCAKYGGYVTDYLTA